jgi:HK97 family phage portal protein
MKHRGLFKTIFGEKETPKENVNATDFNMYTLLNSFNSTYYINTGNAWDMDIVRSAVDAWCRNFAKLKAKHVREGKTGKSKIERLLNYRANGLMEAYSFYYKVGANLKLTNNAFIYPEYSSSGELLNIWPLMSTQLKLQEKNGQLYIRFIFKTGKVKVVPYEDLIHLRGQFFDHDIFGSSNNALRPALEQNATINQGVSNAAKLINSIRGILSAKIASKDEDLAKARDRFVENNFKMSSNGSGVIVTDQKMEYTPINEKTTPISADQLAYTKNAIYDYFGVNENIVQNKFDENQWNAFYEGSIEPIAIQMSQCFTNILFTDNERNFGNEIVFEANRLQYASTSTKVTVVKELSPMGVLTKDDIREIFNMAPLPNGEGNKILQSLNWINAEKADEYQSKGNSNNSDPTPPPKEDDDTTKSNENDDDNNLDNKNVDEGGQNYGEE